MAQTSRIESREFEKIMGLSLDCFLDKLNAQNNLTSLALERCKCMFFGGFRIQTFYANQQNIVNQKRLFPRFLKG